MKRACIFVLICFLSVNVPAKEEPAIPVKIERILSGEAEVPEITEPEVRNFMHRSEEGIRKWYGREKDSLFLFLIQSGITVLAGYALTVLFRRLTRRRQDKPFTLRYQLLFSLAVPLIYSCMTSVIFLFLRPLLHSLPGVYPWGARLFFLILTLLIAWSGFRLITILDIRLKELAKKPENNFDDLMADIIRKLLKTILVIITLLFIGQNIFKLDITTLLAGAGVFGVAIAFASRETLSNFFGTLVIILDRPFRRGDRIQFAGIDGIVESVGMRSTRIQTGKDSVYVVPNSTIASANIENISLNGVIRYMLMLSLTYSTGTAKVSEAIGILHRITDNFHGPDQEKYVPRIYLHSLGESALNLCVIMWLKTGSFDTEENLRTEVNCAILEQFGKAGIEFAYKTETNVISGELTLKQAS